MAEANRWVETMEDWGKLGVGNGKILYQSWGKQWVAWNVCTSIRQQKWFWLESGAETRRGRGRAWHETEEGKQERRGWLVGRVGGTDELRAEWR